MSPLSMHITYELMQRGAKMDLAGCLKMEYGIVQNIMVRLVVSRVRERYVLMVAITPQHTHILYDPTLPDRVEGHRLLPGRACK